MYDARITPVYIRMQASSAVYRVLELIVLTIHTQVQIIIAASVLFRPSPTLAECFKPMESPVHESYRRPLTVDEEVFTSSPARTRFRSRIRTDQGPGGTYIDVMR